MCTAPKSRTTSSWRARYTWHDLLPMCHERRPIFLISYMSRGAQGAVNCISKWKNVDMMCKCVLYLTRTMFGITQFIRVTNRTRLASLNSYVSRTGFVWHHSIHTCHEQDCVHRVVRSDTVAMCDVTPSTCVTPEAWHDCFHVCYEEDHVFRCVRSDTVAMCDVTSSICVTNDVWYHWILCATNRTACIGLCSRTK